MKRINNILLELYRDKDQLLVLSILFSLDYWLQPLLPNNPNVNQAAGALIVAGAGALIGAGVSMWNGSQNRKAAARAAEKAAKEKAKQMKLLNKEKAKYEKFEFTNPYAQAKNQFEDLENTMEDLTVNQQQAQFEAQQGAQQRSNIMETMRGAAGGSGIAALAQTMANQGQLATQRASASIGQQESANQRMQAQQAGQNQSLERQGAQTAEGLRMRGDEMVARQEADRRATILGIQASMAGGAAQAATSADQMSLQTDIQARNQTTQAIASGTQQMAGAAAGQMGSGGGGGGATSMQSQGPTTMPVNTQSGPTGASMTYEQMLAQQNSSDRRLKKNINKISKSPSGLNIYSFEFKDSKYGEGLFQGVMSDEMPQEVVGTRDGYDTVDYSKIDVEFKKINK